MKRGDRLEFQIEKYAFEGKGISRIQKEDSEDTKSGYVVFVNGTYPGDKVIARITKTKKSFAEAVTEKILSPSPYKKLKQNVNTSEPAGDVNSRI